MVALSRQPVAVIHTINTTTNHGVWHDRIRDQILKRPDQVPGYRLENEQIYRLIPDPANYSNDHPATAWKFSVPEDLGGGVLEENHDAVTAGHLGIAKTIARISRLYYWPGMYREISQYMRRCKTCQKFKVTQQRQTGRMHFTPVSQPWEIVTSDFMGPFPRSSKGNTMLLVFHDKFTKWTELIPLH